MFLDFPFDTIDDRIGVESIKIRFQEGNRECRRERCHTFSEKRTMPKTMIIKIRK